MKVFTVLNRILDALLLIFFVITFLVGLYSMIDSALLYEHAEDSSLLKYKPTVSGTSEEKPLKNNVAWLTVDNTNIDYPVMQGEDNIEYLNKDPYGDYSLSGSIFLDCRNKADFSDPYNLVYGHHMDADRMFGQLDQFLDRDFFDSHRSGSLTVGDTYYKIDFIAAFRTPAEDSAIFDVTTTSVSDVLEDIQSKADIDESTGDETHLIALSTCKDTDSTERTILIGTLTEGQMPAEQPERTVRQTSTQAGTMVLPWIILAGIVSLVLFLLIRRGRK